MHFKLSLLLFFFILRAHGSLLVLEFKGEEHTTWHGEEVSAVACTLFLGDCPVKYTDSFNTQRFAESIFFEIEKASVVNMSFSIFAPYAPRRDMRDLISGNTARYDQDLENYRKALKTFEEERVFLSELIRNESEKLFIIAAGNGFALEAMTIPGMVLSERYALYPSIFEYPNTLKVAALESSSLLEDRENYRLAYYSTYSTELVDIAAPVPLNSKGEIQRGTSFAAPWVAGHLANITEAFPTLESHTVKKMAMRSAVIPNIEKALRVSEEYIRDGESSLLFRAQHESNKIKREQLISELGKDILFVKSGGVLHPGILKECALVLSQNPSMNLDQACLMAQEKILGLEELELKYLQSLWAIRGI